MVGNIHLAGRRTASAAGAALVAFLGLVAAFAGVWLSGTKTGAILAGLAVTGPVLFALSFFTPLIFPFGVYALATPFDAVLTIGPASTVTKILGAASAAALLFYIMRSKRFADPDRSVAMWLLYTLWLMASAFWAIDPKESLKLLPTAFLLFGLYAVVSLIRTDMRTLYKVATFAMIGGVLASAYILYMYHSGVAIKEDRMWLVTDSVNWNPDYLAGSLLLPATVAVMTAVFGQSLWTRIGGFASLCIILPTFILTGARGPELGLMLMIAYLIWREPNRARLAWPVGIVLGIALVFAAPMLASRWSDAFASGGAGRTDIWHAAFVAFKQNWLFGAGFNNFPLAYDRAMLQVFQPQYIGWNRASHDIIVGHAVEVGVIGLGLLLLGWYWQFRAMRGIAPGDPRYRMRLLMEAAVLALFVSGLFADIMLTKAAWLVFMLVNLTRNAVPSVASAPAVVRADVSDATSTAPSIEGVPVRA